MSIREEISGFFAPGKRYVAMGVGSVLRSDDGAGAHFAETLSTLCSKDNLEVINGGTAPENFTGVIKDFGPDVLFIVDAAFTGKEIGSISLLDPDDVTGVSFSTHMLPLSFTLSYLEKECGCETVLIGIQPESIEQGVDMCDTVKNSAEELAEIFTQSV